MKSVYIKLHISACVLLTACISQEPEIGSRQTSDVKAYIDPATGELGPPPPDNSTTQSRSFSQQPAKILKGQQQADGSYILEADFRPNQRLIATQTCGGRLKVSHGNTLHQPETKCPSESN